jgi:hypothetical protein
MAIPRSKRRRHQVEPEPGLMAEQYLAEVSATESDDRIA